MATTTISNTNSIPSTDGCRITKPELDTCTLNDPKYQKLFSFKPETKPMMNWWWCATIVGAIPCLITNLLFKKKTQPLKRLVHTSINSGLQNIIVSPQDFHLVNPLPSPVLPLGYVAPLPVPVVEINYENPNTAMNNEDYMNVIYPVRTNPYAYDVSEFIIQCANTQAYHDQSPTDYQQRTSLGIMANTIVNYQYTIHIPTVLNCCKELTPLLEESRRHFVCKTEIRLSRAQINFYYGRMMMPKVITHLTTNSIKFHTTAHNLQATAQEVIYFFLKHSNRILPHVHLISQYDTVSVDDLLYMTRHPRKWTDSDGFVWEIESPLFGERITLCRRCLFQFPTAELNSTVAY